MHPCPMLHFLTEGSSRLSPRQQSARQRKIVEQISKSFMRSIHKNCLPGKPHFKVYGLFPRKKRSEWLSTRSHGPLTLLTSCSPRFPRLPGECGL